jgi:hypothetical protein
VILFHILLSFGDLWYKIRSVSSGSYTSISGLEDNFGFQTNECVIKPSFTLQCPCIGVVTTWIFEYVVYRTVTVPRDKSTFRCNCNFYEQLIPSLSFNVDAMLSQLLFSLRMIQAWLIYRVWNFHPIFRCCNVEEIVKFQTRIACDCIVLTLRFELFFKQTPVQSDCLAEGVVWHWRIL